MRLTNNVRDKLIRNALATVPKVDYRELLKPVIQNVFYKYMPNDVKTVYDNKDSRKFLNRIISVEIRNGNVYDYRINYSYEIIGYATERHITIRMNDGIESSLVPNTLMYDLTMAIRNSDAYSKHIEQVDLYKSVKERLHETVYSVTTTKRLYDVLEPELHKFIPKDPSTENLPVMARPIVSDLKKLGMTFDEVA